MTAARILRALRIRPGEGKVAARLLAVMVVLWGGFGIGASAVESLLLSRHGAGILPWLFVALGPATILTAAALSTLMDGRAGSIVPRLAPLAFAAVVMGMRPLAGSRWDGAFPVLWVLMMVLWVTNGITSWALAGRVHDSRQAKRLFPLYAAGVILGGAIGGLVTPVLASSIGVPNLLYVWAAACGAGYLLAHGVRGATRMPRRRRGGGIAGGLRAIRSSALLRWMATSIVGFAFLYYALTLLFARGVVSRFPDPESLAGFIGAFTGAANAVTLVVSLLAANRLFARFGAAPMVMLLAVIYALAFGLLSFTGSFVALVAFRFLQVVWVYGIWSSGWQALLNVVPAGARDGVRAFLDAGAYPLGVVAAGAVLLLVDAGGIPGGVATVGLVIAAVTAVTSWRARRSYAGALVEALRTGNPDVFGGDRAGIGSVRDRDARIALLRDLDDTDPRTRRVAIDILGGAGSPEVVAALHRAAGDPDAEVRSGAIRALPPGDAATLGVLSAAAEDPDPGVRSAAARSLAAASPEAAVRVPGLRDLLSSDDPSARASAAVALRTSEPDADAAVFSMLGSAKPSWRRAALRAVAVAAAAGHRDDRALEAAITALGDLNPAVRAAAIEACRAFGPDGADRLVAALRDPAVEAAALEALPPHDRSAELLRYIRDRRDQALGDAVAARAIAGQGGDAVELLAWALAHRARERAINAVAAAGSTGDTAALAVAVENLRADGAQRADALETVDAVGERDLIRPLVSIWEADPGAGGDRGAALRAALEDPDPIVRAAAVLATREVDDPALRTIAKAKATDGARIVREAASLVGEDGIVSHAGTLSLVERILFLRGVPLFEGLSPEDLVRVAEVATEEVHAAGTLVAEEGEVGDELHIVIGGEVRVVMGSREIARRGVGEYVGEMSIVSDQPRMASLEAAGETRTLTLDGARFRRILRERPDVGLAVMRVLCDRLRESDAGQAARPVGPTP